jgi:ribose-phosphate pyrophosphokinase
MINKNGQKDSIKIFTGNSNPALAKAVCKKLNISLGDAKVARFSDGEIRIEIKENVRLSQIFIIQSTCEPVNESLMELLMLMDAFRRSSAKRITAVIPYYGYARQDKKVEPRVPISAKLIANLITVAGANRVITMDLHAGQIQGFFDIPVDNIFAAPVLIEYLKNNFKNHNLVVLSPDAGGVERARAFAKRLGSDLAIVNKRRSEPNKAKAMEIIGEVEGRIVIILDDMVDTAGTLTEAANIAIKKGAKEVHASCTHPVLSGPAVQRIKDSVLKTVIVTDTIPLNKEAENCKKIKTLSIVNLISETISRSCTGESVTSLFV